MKKLLLTVAALPLALYAGQAAAQVNSNARGGVTVQSRIANLESRYNAGMQAGVFSRSERDMLYRQIADLRALERSYSYDGLSENERRTLQQRIRLVRDQLRMAGSSDWANRSSWSDRDFDLYTDAHSGGVAYDAYGRPVPQGGVVYDQYGRVVANRGVAYDAYGRPIPNGGVVYDQFGRVVANSGVAYDQYGRPINNGSYNQASPYYGQGGPYEPVQQQGVVGNILGGVLGNMVGGGSGVGGILGTILGRGGLRTGDVITGTIGSVLGSAMGSGSRYRDNNEVSFRSDGYRVYEIDARTNRVIRIHPISR